MVAELTDFSLKYLTKLPTRYIVQPQNTPRLYINNSKTIFITNTHFINFILLVVLIKYIFKTITEHKFNSFFLSITGTFIV